MNNKFYITTTLPYVNADPHLGFALEIIQADTVARFHKEILNEDVIFNFGTDEHGQKIYQKALAENKDPQTYCDEYAKKFDALKKALNLSYTNFIRTTDPHHIKAAQEFWKRCLENGDVYKKTYRQKYCVGCELEKTDSELIENRCPIHPNLEVEIIEEENWFFRFSKYQKDLLELFESSDPVFVIPEGKLNEIKTFVKDGLQDFSISRLKTKMPWGIEVPGDPEHVMYVWFDALINYISTLGWPEDKKTFNEYWPGVQVAGKDNLRQQTAIWQAMLKSASLPYSKQIYIHGFISLNGQKISKSLGNTIDPTELVKKYGTDPVRYYLLAKVNPYEDSDFTIEKFEETYNSDLANGLGNLVARVAKLCEKSEVGDLKQKKETSKTLQVFVEKYDFNEGINYLWQKIKLIDQKINFEEPWKISDQKKLHESVVDYAQKILDLSHELKPFLPETAEKIRVQFSSNIIKSHDPLFPRLK